MADEKIPSTFPDEKIEVLNDTAGTNIDPIAEKKLLRKCDLRVLPPLFVLFLMAFLDRTNIGSSLSPSFIYHTSILTSVEGMPRFKASLKT